MKVFMNTKKSIATLVSIFLHAYMCALTLSVSTLNADEKKETLAPVALNAIPDPNKNKEIAPTQTETKKVGSENNTDEILLNFQNVSLRKILDYLAEDRLVDGKKMNIIPNADLDAIKVSLISKTSFTREKAWDVLLTLLESNKYSIIKVGDTHRVLPFGSIPQEPLPILSGDINALPNNDEIIRYLYFLRNIKTDMVSDIIKTMIGDKSLTGIHKDLGMLLITAPSKNIRATMKIIEALDTGGLSESIQVLKIENHDADTIASLFNEQIIGNQQKNEKGVQLVSPQLGKKEARYFSQTTRVISDPTKNCIVLMGQLDEIEKIKFFIKKCLDVPQDSAESRLHVKDIKFISSEKIQPLLVNSILKPRGTGNDKSPLVEGFKFFDDVVINAEVPANGSDTNFGSGNRLIIACNSEDWKRLEALIDKLDKPAPQVALEIMIVDVSLQSTKRLESQTRLKKNGLLGPNVGMQAFNMTTPTTTNPLGDSLESDLIATLPAGSLGSFLTLGKTSYVDAGGNIIPGNVWSVIQAILSDANTNIISQPFLLANNRESCEIQNNETQPVQGDIDASGGRQVIRPNKLNANNIIKITPRINGTGTVDLTISVQVDNFSANPGTFGPTVNNRLLSTRTTMGTGEVLILGGLTESTQTENTYKTPLLGDIPIIGFFFKSKSKVTIKKNLYVFIRPSVIKPHIEGAPDDYTQLKLDYAKYQTLNMDSISNDADPIQRWFFKPKNTNSAQKAIDYKAGVFRPIDDFTHGKETPVSVNIARDPYYSTSESRNETKTKDSKRNKKSALKKKSQKKAVENELKPTVQINNKLHQEFEEARALWKEKGWLKAS